MIPTSVRYRLECEMSFQNNLQVSYLSQLVYTSKGGATPFATISLPLPQPQLILLLFKSCSPPILPTFIRKSVSSYYHTDNVNGLSKTLTSEIRR